MSLTAPVSQENFYFSNGDLFVETSGANRHRRATVSELRDLFHPRHNSNVPVRDPPAHWYEAQLVHYGLPSSRAKGTAVKRLLDAVNSGRLAVPQTILSMEKRLKKQWDANERKARREANDGASTSGRSVTKSQGTKRKAEEIQNHASVGVNGVNINLNINMGSMGMQTAEPARAARPAVRKPNNATKAKQRKEQALSRQTDPLLILERERTPYGGSTQPAMRRPVRPKARMEAKVRTEPKVNPDPRIKEEKLSPSTPRKTKTEHNFSDDYPPPSPSPSTLSLGLINGIYSISCPEVTEQWGRQGLNITICFDTQHVWCAYDFKMFSGIFLLNRRPVRASNEQIPLRWRGRENGEGEMTIGDDNHGWISFPGGGRIEGSVEIMGDFDFEGYKVERCRPTRSARSMRDEWESYSEEAYEFERVNRWR
jgi:hypothetical protein